MVTFGHCFLTAGPAMRLPRTGAAKDSHLRKVEVGIPGFISLLHSYYSYAAGLVTVRPSIVSRRPGNSVR